MKITHEFVAINVVTSETRWFDFTDDNVARKISAYFLGRSLKEYFLLHSCFEDDELSYKNIVDLHWNANIIEKQIKTILYGD